MGDGVRKANAPATDLVERIAQGDRSAEEALVKHYQRGARLLLLHKTQGDLQLAEDLCQETLITVIRRLRQKPLDEPEKLAAFIHGVARRLFTGDLRKTIRRGTNPDSERIEATAATSDDPIETLSRDACRDVVRQLIDEMPVARDREVLVRAYVLDQDKETVCAATGLDFRHYDRVIHRARQRFKKLAEENVNRERLTLV